MKKAQIHKKPSRQISILVLCAAAMLVFCAIVGTDTFLKWQSQKSKVAARDELQHIDAWYRPGGTLVADEIYDSGCWTAGDLFTNPRRVCGYALRKVYKGKDTLMVDLSSVDKMLSENGWKLDVSMSGKQEEAEKVFHEGRAGQLAYERNIKGDNVSLTLAVLPYGDPEQKDTSPKDFFYLKNDVSFEPGEYLIGIKSFADY